MNVIRLGTLAQFVEEVPTDRVLRLDLTERLQSNKNQIPFKDIQLHLQAVNDIDQIVWLMESHRICWLPHGHGPLGPVDQSIYDGMIAMQRLIKMHLQAHGYKIRHGSFAFSEGLEPVNGQFEVIKWHEQDDGTYAVTLLEKEERIAEDD